MVTREETTVDEVDAPRLLVLTARGWPFGEARVTLKLIDASIGSTHVSMEEVPVAGPGKWAHNPLGDLILARRNTEALARLTALVQRRTSPPDASRLDGRHLESRVTTARCIPGAACLGNDGRGSGHSWAQPCSR